MSPIFEDTFQFFLELDNGCLEDEITINTDIDDYIYYINEDTYSPDFIQGTAIPQLKSWTPDWSQTVDGCPVEYLIATTETDEDDVVTRTDATVW